MSQPAPKRRKKKSQPPTLSWLGKRPPGLLPPPAAELVEVFEPEAQLHLGFAGDNLLAPSPQLLHNLLFHGDNRAVLTHLLAHGYRGQVKLIYIDPPYASGVKWGRKVRLRGPKALTMQTSAENIFGKQEQYNDQWDDNDYLQFMVDRLPLLRDLLTEDGSLWLHCDHRKVHHLHILLEEIFGAENYLNTISWRSQVARGAKVNAFYFPFSTHYIEIFAKKRRTPTTWNLSKRQIILTESEAAREFMRDEYGFFRTSDPGAYSFASLKALHAEQRLYAPFGGKIVVDEAAQRIYGSQGGNIGIKYYLANLGSGKWAVERAIDNLWDDIPGLGTTPGEDLGYPTQKTAALLERVIRTASNPGDLVLDCFMGSGTTLAVAQQLGRRWIGCDNNYGAVQTTRRRLQAKPTKGTLTEHALASFSLYQMAGAAPTPLPPVPNMAHASLEIARNSQDATKIGVEILEYTSPTLLAQLAPIRKQGNLACEPWRAMVDCIAIDPAYDGQVFRASMVDAPLRRSDQVAGYYRVTAPAQPTCVAVRITDVLGEELLVTNWV